MQGQVIPTGRNLPLHPLPPGRSLSSQCLGYLACPKMQGPSPEEEEHGPASSSLAGKSSRCHLPRKKNLSLLPLTHVQGPPENLDLSSACWLLCVDPVQGWKKSTKNAANARSSWVGRGDSLPHCCCRLGEGLCQAWQGLCGLCGVQGDCCSQMSISILPV